MIHQIEFENYKGFKRRQKLELRPITILIGKNNSGKSAVLRMVEMLAKSLAPTVEMLDTPLILRSNNFDKNFDFDFGGNYLDLSYKRNTKPLFFSILLSNNQALEVSLRYYDEWKALFIERYSLSIAGNTSSFGNSTDNILYNFEIDINKLPEKEYTKIDEKIPYKTSLDFYGLCFDLGTLGIGAKERKRDMIYYTPSNNHFFVKYTPPLRPKIDRNCDERDTSRTSVVPLSLLKSSELLDRVSNWYQKNMGLGGGTVDRVPTTTIFNVNVQLQDSTTSLHISDTGKGIEQSLPVVVDALSKREYTINIIEQPELHLHPAPQAAIGQLFAESAKDNPSSKFLIETHSENLLLRLRRLVAEGFLQPSDLAIYSVEYDENIEASELKLINVDEWGNVDYWPEGVFSENFEEVRALREAQRKKIEKI